MMISRNFDILFKSLRSCQRAGLSADKTRYLLRVINSNLNIGKAHPKRRVIV